MANEKLTTIQCRIKLSRSQIKRLAIESRVLREEPRKSWTVRECKEHARYAIQGLVEAFLAAKGFRE